MKNLHKLCTAILSDIKEKNFDPSSSATRAALSALAADAKPALKPDLCRAALERLHRVIASTRARYPVQWPLKRAQWNQLVTWRADLGASAEQHNDGTQGPRDAATNRATVAADRAVVEAGRLDPEKQIEVHERAHRKAMKKEKKQLSADGLWYAKVSAPAATQHSVLPTHHRCGVQSLWVRFSRRLRL